VKNIFATAAIAAVVSCTFAAPYSHAQGTLLARGTLTGSKAGSYRDLSGLNNTLENGVPANLLGGLRLFRCRSGRLAIRSPTARLGIPTLIL
jgi:hypothetical protein